MVFDPKKRPHHLPRSTPKSYILTTANGANFVDMVRDINDLISKEGPTAKVSWGNQMPAIGVAVLECDAAFAAKVGALPSVGSIEPDHPVTIQTTPKKKHGGPSL